MHAERIISADDHIDLCYLSPELWTSRLPAKYREAGPRVMDEPGGKAWVKEGKRWGAWGTKKADNRIIVYDRAGLAEEPEPGVWRGVDPKYRLMDIDEQGIWGTVLYNFLDWGFQDQELKAACAAAYNDWLAEELCPVAPERLIGLGVLPSHDADAAIAEMHRCLGLGLRGMIFDFFGATIQMFDPHWHKLWRAAEEAGVPIHVHIGGGAHTLPKIARGVRYNYPAAAAVLGMQFDEIVALAIFSGMLDKHPNLKFVMGECGIGWLPYVLERLDYEVHQFRDVLGGVGISRPPREIFASQVFATFQDETFGVRMIPEIGVGNVMWAADFPHGDGTFPHTKQAIARMFGNADPVLRRKVLFENAAALYGIA